MVQQRLAAADARLASLQDELDSQREGIWPAPDMAVRDLDYDTLRLSYRQIWNQWTSTQRSLIHQIAR